MTNRRRGKTTAQSNTGSFRGKDQSGPEGELNPTPAGLGEALSGLGLSVEDVPGLTAAWAERFGPLESPRPEGSVEVANRVLGVAGLHPNRLSTFVHFDEGGADTAVVEVVTDSVLGDDDWSTTDSFRYVLTSEQYEQVAAARANNGAATEWDRLARERADLIAGKSPAWHVLADRDELAEAASAFADAVRGSQKATRVAEAAEEFADRVDLAERGGFDWQQGGRALITRDSDRGLERDFTVRSAHELLTRFARANERADAACSVMEQARALPAGALRDFLLAERPEATYSVVEGKGRSKRIVTKSYQPKSELTQEFETATRVLEDLTPGHTAVVREMQRLRDEASRARAAAAAAEQLEQAAHTAWWEQGWTGQGTPPAPKNR